MKKCRSHKATPLWTLFVSYSSWNAARKRIIEIQFIKSKIFLVYLYQELFWPIECSTLGLSSFSGQHFSFSYGTRLSRTQSQRMTGSTLLICSALKSFFQLFLVVCENGGNSSDAFSDECLISILVLIWQKESFAKSVWLGSYTNFDVACYTAWSVMNAFICSSISKAVIRINSFAHSLLDKCSDRWHKEFFERKLHIFCLTRCPSWSKWKYTCLQSLPSRPYVVDPWRCVKQR